MLQDNQKKRIIAKILERPKIWKRIRQRIPREWDVGKLFPDFIQPLTNTVKAQLLWSDREINTALVDGSQTLQGEQLLSLEINNRLLQ